MTPHPEFTRDRLRPLRVGLLLSLCAMMLGFALGGAFGAAEDTLKGDLRGRAEAVLDTRYGGDPAKASAVVDKSWSYYKRAHLHTGVLGGAGVALILLLAVLGPPGRAARGSAIFLGVGALAYGGFWLLAGYVAPVLGGTAAAKEALRWLAIPGAGALLVGLGGTIFLSARALFGSPKPGGG